MENATAGFRMAALHPEVEFYKPHSDSLRLKQAQYHVRYGGWNVFPVHVPARAADGTVVGCTCETYRWTAECKQNHPHIYLAPGERCTQPGKCPAVKWASRSTQDQKQIRKWWGHAWLTHPATPGKKYVPNIGGDCGKSHKLVLDADKYKDNYAGDNLLPRLDENTVTHLTGRGGSHLVYAMPADKHYGNATGDLPEGIDIRGYGGFVVLPGSEHETGNIYQFEAGYAPHEIDFLEVPPALQAILDNAHGNRGRGADGRPEVGPSDIAAVNRSMATVERALEHGDIAHNGAQAWDGDGRKYILHDCPFNPADDPHGNDAASFVVIYQDGKIGAGCHHARCQSVIEHAAPRGRPNGWAALKELVGYVAPAPVSPEQLAAYKVELASPATIEDLKADGFRNPERARKLIDTILQCCERKQRLRITPGYAYLAEQSGISKAGLGAYLARLFSAGYIELYGAEKGKAQVIELVLHNLNSSTSRHKSVQVVENWNLYREFRPDELFINGHAAYTATHTKADLSPLGDNGLSALLPLQDGPLTIKDAAEETGHSYGAMARTLRRYAEHGLVDVDIGERNRKTYSLKAEWRAILQANRPRTTTYGVALFRREKAIGSRIKYLLATGGDAEKIDKLEAERKRLRAIVQAVQLAAGIVPYSRQRKGGVLRGDPLAEWEQYEPVWHIWKQFAGDNNERMRQMLHCGFERGDVERMLQLVPKALRRLKPPIPGTDGDGDYIELVTAPEANFYQTEAAWAANI